MKNIFGISSVIIGTLIFSAGLANAAGLHKQGGNPYGEMGKPQNISRTLTIDMYDSDYSLKNITVKQGETIRFVINNVGELVHEFNIGNPAGHTVHQKEMEMMMDSGMLEYNKINQGAMKHNDPNSILLAPGQSGEILWKFSKDTELQFACNVPGHYEAGMLGNITINH